jgi:hypothetical protein
VMTLSRIALNDSLPWRSSPHFLQKTLAYYARVWHRASPGVPRKR